RVGAKIKARGPSPLRRGAVAKNWISGRANDAVFPVPVCAQAKTSCLRKITGIACSCIGVGVWQPASSNTSSIGWAKSNAENCKMSLLIKRAGSIQARASPESGYQKGWAKGTEINWVCVLGKRPLRTTLPHGMATATNGVASLEFPKTQKTTRFARVVFCDR